MNQQLNEGATMHPSNVISSDRATYILVNNEYIVAVDWKLGPNRYVAADVMVQAGTPLAEVWQQLKDHVTKEANEKRKLRAFKLTDSEFQKLQELGGGNAAAGIRALVDQL